MTFYWYYLKCTVKNQDFWIIFWYSILELFKFSQRDLSHSLEYSLRIFIKKISIQPVFNYIVDSAVISESTFRDGCGWWEGKGHCGEETYWEILLSLQLVLKLLHLTVCVLPFPEWSEDTQMLTASSEEHVTRCQVTPSHRQEQRPLFTYPLSLSLTHAFTMLNKQQLWDTDLNR